MSYSRCKMDFGMKVPSELKQRDIIIVKKLAKNIKFKAL
jgi:hypothetical protein